MASTPSADRSAGADPRASLSLACVTGRLQPVHEQHLELIDQALCSYDHVIIAITNPDAGARQSDPSSTHRHTTEANPFTYFERAVILAAVLHDRGILQHTTIVPFDLTRPEYWFEYVPANAHHFIRAYSSWERKKAQTLEKGGYHVTVIDGEPQEKVSATSIRQLMLDDGAWTTRVPEASIPALEKFLSHKPMLERQ